MRTHRHLVAILTTLVLAPRAGTAANIVVDTGATHQTMMSWGASLAGPLYSMPPALRAQMIDEYVNDLGLNRLRYELYYWEDPANDDGDPDHIEWAKFDTATVDAHFKNGVLPFRQAVLARGDTFSLYSDQYGSRSLGWFVNSPGEYAEWASSFALYVKNTYGFAPDYISLQNEPNSNGTVVAPAELATMGKALGAKLAGHGLSTLIEFPECTDADASWSYVQAVQGDSEFWSYVGMVSWHDYGGSDVGRAGLAGFAKARGLPSAQSEIMNGTVNQLYNDVVVGNVASWEQYGIGGYLKWNLDGTAFTWDPRYWGLRQVMHYVRQGSVRIDANSNDPAVGALGFTKNGATTVVLLNTLAQVPVATTANLSGLSPGIYGVAQGSRPYQELGLVTVGMAGTVSIALPAYAVITLYPYPGINQPPTVTGWQSTPDRLILPNQGVTLAATATDPERDPLSYAWTVTSQPNGANPTLAAPNAATTQVAGMSIPGHYVFTVTVKDATHSVARDVMVDVFAIDQPPVILEVFAVPEVITSPTSTGKLVTFAQDPEGEVVAYAWTVVSQPLGANVVLASPNAIQTLYSNATVAGTYVFQVAASDAKHTVTRQKALTVYPVNPSAPTIATLGASPAVVTLPMSTTLLSATASDADGDTISPWWSVKSGPAKAQLAQPGAYSTGASGLTVPGLYVFTFSVVDRTRITQKDVTVMVLPGADGGSAADAGADGAVDAGGARDAGLIKDASAIDLARSDAGLRADAAADLRAPRNGATPEADAAPPPATAGSGCQVGARSARHGGSSAWFALLCAVSCARLRRGRRR